MSLIRSVQFASDVMSIVPKAAPAAPYDALSQIIANASDPVDLQDALTLDRMVIPPFAEVWNRIDFDSHAGQNGYTLPIGNYFHRGNAAPIGLATRVYVDQGAGFNELYYDDGDYSHIGRSANGYHSFTAAQRNTVFDMAFGVFLGGGIVAAGWRIRLEWRERHLTVPVAPMAQVHYPIDNSVVWRPGREKKLGPLPDPRPNEINVNFPNAVNVRCPSGLQVEFWRRSLYTGGRRGAADPWLTQNGNVPGLRRLGRRYYPYFRGEVGRSLFNLTANVTQGPTYIDFPHLERGIIQKHKVCYYDPQSGARSGFSRETVVVGPSRNIPIGIRNKGTNNYQAGSDTPHARASNSVWIED